MNIGFDFDKVFIGYPPFVPSWIIDKLYKQRDDDILSYRIPGKLEQYFRKLTHLPIFRQPIKQNIQHLQDLSDLRKHDLYLISSRFGFLEKQTERLTKKLGLEKVFNKMYFNYKNEQPHQFKSRLVKELSIHRYIDDDLSLIKYLAKENPKTIFFWLNDSLEKKLTNNIYALTRISDITT